MAKALFGHVGMGSDPHLVAELTRLRGKVRELEQEVERLRSAQELLGTTVVVPDTVAGSGLREPALA